MFWIKIFNVFFEVRNVNLIFCGSSNLLPALQLFFVSPLLNISLCFNKATMKMQHFVIRVGHRCIKKNKLKWKKKCRGENQITLWSITIFDRKFISVIIQMGVSWSWNTIPVYNWSVNGTPSLQIHIAYCCRIFFRHSTKQNRWLQRIKFYTILNLEMVINHWTIDSIIEIKRMSSENCT